MAEMLKLDGSVRDSQRGANGRRRPVRVLKHGDSFAVFDPHGDVVPAAGRASTGSITPARASCRASSCCSADRQPLLLSSTISEDNTVFTADLTNPDVVQGRPRRGRAAGCCTCFARACCRTARWIECLRVTNHALHAIEAPLSFRFDADFADVFEVRGTRRAARGQRLPPTSRRRSRCFAIAGWMASSGRRAFDRCVRPDRADEGSLVVPGRARAARLRRDRDRDQLRSPRARPRRRRPLRRDGRGAPAATCSAGERRRVQGR